MHINATVRYRAITQKKSDRNRRFRPVWMLCHLIPNEIKKSRYDMVVIWARSSLFTAMARFFIRGGGRLLKNYGAIRTRGRCWRRGKNFSSRFFFSFGMSEYAMHEWTDGYRICRSWNRGGGYSLPHPATYIRTYLDTYSRTYVVPKLSSYCPPGEGE